LAGELLVPLAVEADHGHAARAVEHGVAVGKLLEGFSGRSKMSKHTLRLKDS
jgi:hypothetical protein